MYVCGVCSLAVVVSDGQVIRGCSCDGPVIAEMSASAHGTGGVRS